MRARDQPDRDPDWQADALDDEQMRAWLVAAKDRSRLSFEQLGQTQGLSKTTVENFLKKPGHPRDQWKLGQLLDALKAEPEARAAVLELQARIEARRDHRSRSGGAGLAVRTGWRARAEAAGCVVWTLEEFTASEATVHTAIGRRVDVDQPHDPQDLPPYIARDHDKRLREEIRQAAAGKLPAMILLRGTSSTGKTRSLFEAIHELQPEPVIIRPQDSAALRALPRSGVFDRPVVVWLNELQGFLGPDGTGLSRHVLRELFTAAKMSPVVLATLWPDKQRTNMALSGDSASETSQLLAPNQWVRIHDVLARFTATERAAAQQYHQDPRIAAALTDPNQVGFTQTLAGGLELLEYYRSAPTLTQLLLDAAADARRLGHTHPLTAPLLESATRALWQTDHTDALDDSWFHRALHDATQRLRSTDGIRALIPLATPDGQHTGYALADYLEQHLRRTRVYTPITDQLWTALLTHADHPHDLSNLAVAARDRGRYIHVEDFYRRSVDAGNPEARVDLAEWLSGRPGRETDAEQAYREAAAAGDPEALWQLAWWLQKQAGRQKEAEQGFRQAAASGNPEALRMLARWLSGRPGRETEAEQVFRQAAAAQDPWALHELARWLSERPGRETEAEQVYREAAAGGNPEAVSSLAWWLREAGREADVGQVFRQAAAAGNPQALPELARWLNERPGGEADAGQVYREAVAAGNPRALPMLARWLNERPGREADAEQVYREVSAAGIPEALGWLALWLREAGREADVEQVYRAAAAARLPDAMHWLAWWLREEVPEADAEQVFRQAVAAGNPEALPELARWLSGRPGRETDAEQAYRQSAADGNPQALPELARWLSGRPGRATEAEQVYREAAAAGNPEALSSLAWWLRTQAGREADVEQAYRQAATAGMAEALLDLTWLLDRWVGREAEADKIRRFGLTADGDTADE